EERAGKVVVSCQFSVVSSQLSVPSSQFPVPSSQFPVPSSQFPVPSSQFPVPNPASPVVARQWLELRQIEHGAEDVVCLRQDCVFENGLIGDEDIFGGDAAHRGVEFLE